jgi:glucose-6-phosphate 1-dehydrogenase
MPPISDRQGPREAYTIGPAMAAPEADPCTLVIFGASGDLTKRLLVPAIYNLACDGLLSDRLEILGVARDMPPDEAFREKMSADLRQFKTREELDGAVWGDLARRLSAMTGDFDDPALYQRLAARLGGNVLFYLATPPALFALIAERLSEAGLDREATGAWRRLIVEKPFGHDLASALDLNRRLLSHWREEQIFRIDHYLGKETVQNLLAFRFSNGMFEPLWNRSHVDHIQFTVSEAVGVEGRGRYYDRAGALRDMIQNHMFQMLAYLCMEPPSSFRADAIRNEKAKVLEAVRVLRPAEVLANTVRGQYRGYREEKDVDPASTTETFAALKLAIDTWRWEGVPIYLRSGKSLWKRDTEIMVQLKKAPEVVFRDVPEVESLEHNQLIFHIQPDQGIELRFQAKNPGPAMALQTVNMRFQYQEAFEAARGTGYEVLLYHAMIGDATLFTRNDLVEAAWRVVQPILDTWAEHPPADFPNYEPGSWGPKAAFGLIERDGRKWLESLSRAVLEKVPLFQGASPVFLHGLAMDLKPMVVGAGEEIVRKGDPGKEMYVVARGEVVVEDEGRVLKQMGEGSFFGERSLIFSKPRSASVRAVTPADLFVLERDDFLHALRDQPLVARSILELCKARDDLDPAAVAAFEAQLEKIL